MVEDIRRWTHRHSRIVYSFLVGITSGILVFVLAYFTTRQELAAKAIRYGVQVTGHSDIGEDLAWLFCGIAIGASVTCLAWWRDRKAQSVGLEKAHILNRLLADPTSPTVQEPEGSLPDADMRP